MRAMIYALGLLLVLATAWYFTWRGLMADDVAQVQATIAHHNAAIRANTPTANFKADDVYATGFPFAFRVAVTRPTLTQIWGDESFAVSFEKIELQQVNDVEGRYRVLAPATFDAMYAKTGNAPEQYRIALNEIPAVLLRATGNSARCSPMPGAQRCVSAPTDPLVSFAVQLPRKLLLDVTLNGETKQIGFTFMPMNIPLFATIPANVSHPLQIFVGMLREAMVFRK